MSVGILLAQNSRVQLRRSKVSIRPVTRRAAAAADARPSSSYAQFEGGVGTVSTSSASTNAESSKAVLEDTKLFLESELQGLFATGVSCICTDSLLPIHVDLPPCSVSLGARNARLSIKRLSKC